MSELNKTILEDFLEHYPNVVLSSNGIPGIFCPSDLGLKDLETCDWGDTGDQCVACWNQRAGEQE